MRRSIHNRSGKARFALWALALLPALTGCSLTGTWSTASVRPADERFDLSHVSFDKQGRYTATARYDGTSRTSVGSYRFNGRKLIINPDNGSQRAYACKRGLSDELTLVYETVVVKIEATLTKVGE